MLVSRNRTLPGMLIGALLVVGCSSQPQGLSEAEVQQRIDEAVATARTEQEADFALRLEDEVGTAVADALARSDVEHQVEVTQAVADALARHEAESEPGLSPAAAFWCRQQPLEVEHTAFRRYLDRADIFPEELTRSAFAFFLATNDPASAEGFGITAQELEQSWAAFGLAWDQWIRAHPAEFVESCQIAFELRNDPEPDS